jgi:dTDP-4-dehydrorhamnose reductase
MTRVLVTGAGGQLGGAIADEFGPDHEVTATTRADLDITDSAAIAAIVERVAPAVIVNCVGYNAVDAAEDAPRDALTVNAFAVRSLARAAVRASAVFVHYSTDFVFDGTSTRPYTEDDRPNPRSVYAESKLLGEFFARDVPRHYVLRVESLFGGRRRRSSVDLIVDAILARREARVFADRTISPSYTFDVARATREVVRREIPSGIYHCVNGGSVTWLGLAEEALRRLHVEAPIVPVRLQDVSLRAERPLYSVLSNERLASFGIVMPPWSDALARYLLRRTAEDSGRLVHQATNLSSDRETGGQSG